MFDWEYRRTVLALCVLALFVTVFGRLALSPVVPDIAQEYGTTNALIGGILTAMWLAYALTQFPSGMLADRYGDRLLIALSTGGTGLSALVLAVAPTLWLFAVGAVFLGGVAGFHYSVGTTLLTNIYDDTGTAIGIHNAGAPLAGLAAPVVVSWVAVRYGWRPAVALTVVIGVPSAFMIMHWIRSSTPRKPDRPVRTQFEWEPMTHLLGRPAIAFTGIIAVLYEAAWQGIASFLPTFLIQYHAYSTTFAGMLFAGYFVVQGALQIGVGVAADRLGRDITIAVCALAGIVAVALLVQQDNLPAVILGVSLLGLGMGHSPAVFARFMDRLTDGERSFGFGLFRTSYMVLAAPGSIILGVLADSFDWGVSIGAVAVSLSVVCALLLVNYAVGFDY